MKAVALVLLLAALPAGAAWAQQAQGFGNSPFEREFGAVRFLDAYFGLPGDKAEVGPGDRNVPLTVVMANVGTQDITGISGQLSLPTQFSPSSGTGPAYADAEASSRAGENFALTFFVDVSETASLSTYPATAKVDFSRLRESGTRSAYLDFEFNLPGDTIINMRALDPFLTSLRENRVTVEISNDGTAPVSDVELVLQNTAMADTDTNVENVVMLGSNWEVGNIGPGQARTVQMGVYVPESVRGDSLRAPIRITYFNANGDEQSADRVVDFFVQGLIDLDIYDVRARQLADRMLVVGDVINEGNADALFAFVTLSPRAGSNIVETRQFVDEIDTDSPVPFNIPVEFDGQPRYGEHDVTVTVRYKDTLREEQFVSEEHTVVIPAPPAEDGSGPDIMTLAMMGGAAAAVAAGAAAYKRRKSG